MFTPENVKKLTNVTTITLKKYGKKYELAVFPNKLYEYKSGMTTNLDEILHTFTIYKNVSKGEICSKADLSKFKAGHMEIIKEILDYGYEQKPKETRNYEVSQTENEILGLIGKKIIKDGKYVHESILRDVVNKVHQITPGDAKKQSQEIITKLTRMGYERVKIRVRVFGEVQMGVRAIASCDMNKYGYFSDVGEWDGEFLHIESSKFPQFKALCKEKGILFVVTRPDEEEDEVIE